MNEKPNESNSSSCSLENQDEIEEQKDIRFFMQPRLIVSNSFNFRQKKGKINLNKEESLKLKSECRS